MFENLPKDNLEGKSVIGSRYDSSNDKIIFLIQGQKDELNEYQPTQKELHSFLNFLVSEKKDKLSVH